MHSPCGLVWGEMKAGIRREGSADHVRPVGGEVIEIGLCGDDSEQAAKTLVISLSHRLGSSGKGGDAPVDRSIDARVECGVESVRKRPCDVLCV